MLYSTEATMHGDAEIHSGERLGDAHRGPWHIGEVLAEMLLLQLPEMDTAEAAQVLVAAT
jgi:hypothetical protein